MDLNNGLKIGKDSCIVKFISKFQNIFQIIQSVSDIFKPPSLILDLELLFSNPLNLISRIILFFPIRYVWENMDIHLPPDIISLIYFSPALFGAAIVNVCRFPSQPEFPVSIARKFCV
jgi:hypothetical protein